MSTAVIGIKISQLRKEKGVTQEELAKSVCVSPQAVSKWENGGVPDTELLPKIADFFEVSIDALFGRNITNYSDIEKALERKIAETDNELVFETVFELCWVMERAMFGRVSVGHSIKEYKSKLGKNDQTYSSVLSDRGYTRMGIANRLQYFLIVPEVEDKGEAFFNGIDYVAFFKDFSDKSVYDTMVMLNKREHSKSFTPNLLMKNIGVDFDKALEIIKTLFKYGVIDTTEIELDDVVQEVYTFVPTPSFTAMLIFAREIIDKPDNFSYYMGGRNRPYLS